MFVDFHTHSTCSDGRLSPKDLFNMAKEAKIQHFAFTDHDTVKAFDEFKRLINNSDKRENNRYFDHEGVRVYCACEFSTSYKGKSVHILGYALDSTAEVIKRYEELFKERRTERIKKMVLRCATLGYEISFDELLEDNPEQNSWGRPHIGTLLIKKGLVPNMKVAFDTLLAKGQPAYVSSEKFKPEEIIALIHEANGLAVLAHPSLIKNDEYVHDLLKLPFDGLEVYHPENEGKYAYYEQLAKAKALFITGGSDFHGIPERFPEDLSILKLKEEVFTEFISRLEKQIEV